MGHSSSPTSCLHSLIRAFTLTCLLDSVTTLTPTPTSSPWEWTGASWWPGVLVWIISACSRARYTTYLSCGTCWCVTFVIPLWPPSLCFTHSDPQNVTGCSFNLAFVLLVRCGLKLYWTWCANHNCKITTDQTTMSPVSPVVRLHTIASWCIHWTWMVA